AQLPAYRSVAGGVRLSYAQFEELEEFARLGADLDESTRATLARGRRVRAVLAQGALETVSVGRQLIALLAVNEGLLDGVETGRVHAVEAALDSEVRALAPDVVARLEAGE